jgi:Phosphoglucose isomerase
MAAGVGPAAKGQGIEPLTKRKAWKAREDHYQEVRKLQVRNLFADDPGRGERLAAEAVGVFFDYSKNRVADHSIKLLLQLAEESGLRARIDAMFRGEKINIMEKRAVLHVALSAPRGTGGPRKFRGRLPFGRLLAAIVNLLTFSRKRRPQERREKQGNGPRYSETCSFDSRARHRQPCGGIVDQ